MNINNIIDAGLCIANVLSIKENHTEARSVEEKKKQRERRTRVSDLRNAAFILKRFLR